MRVLAIALVALVALGACRKTNPSCERAVKHVIALTTSGPPGSEPQAEEQRVIDQVIELTIERCSDEGLSDAQRDCILAATSLAERTFLMCPALVAKKPSWVIAPIGHPELIEQIEPRDAGT